MHKTSMICAVFALFSATASLAQTQFSNVSAQPTVFPPGGGQLQLSVNTSDSVGVNEVSAHIQYPEGYSEVKKLVRSSGNAQSGYWTVTVQTRKNFTSYDKYVKVFFAAFNAQGVVSTSAEAAVRIPPLPASDPKITITNIGGSDGEFILRGTVANADPAKYQITGMIFVPNVGWFTKPYCSPSNVDINPDLTWRLGYNTGGEDHNATILSVYLVRKTESFCTLGATDLPEALEKDALARDLLDLRPGNYTMIRYNYIYDYGAGAGAEVQMPKVEFAGKSWFIKTSAGAVGPDANHFSERCVSVDSRGDLHLFTKKTTAVERACRGEIYSQSFMGYGTYQTTLLTPVENIPKNVVVGWFLFSDTGSYHNNEIDVEIFPHTDGTNAHFALQPATGNLIKPFKIPAGTGPVTFSFNWQPGSIYFRAWKGQSSSPLPQDLLQEWIYRGASSELIVPPSTDQRLRFNVWTLGGQPPTGGEDVEIVFTNFRFLPSRPTLPAMGIVNAASYLGGALSPGELITGFGSGMGPEKLVVDQSFVPTPNPTPPQKLPTMLAGTRVLFDGQPSPILYTREDQWSAFVPFSLADKTKVNVQVEYNGNLSETVTLPVVKAHPGVFTRTQTGKGVVAALTQDYKIHGCDPLTSVRTGEWFTFFLTGLGQTAPPGIDGNITRAPYPAPTLPVSVMLNGIPMEILYVGNTPFTVEGISQINIRFPRLQIIDRRMPMVVTVGEASSQPIVYVCF